MWGEYPFDLQTQTDMVENVTQDSDWRELLHED